jgi:hypothetical protein
MTKCGIISALAVSLASPTAAMADWAYTHWGMTAEQVVAASGGSVKLLPPGERTRNDPDQWELAAQGNFLDGALTLPVGFTFDTKTGGLQCVMYNASGSDVEVLRGLLDKRYGKPKTESDYGSARGSIWKTPDEIEFVAGQKPVAAVVTHCAPDGQ